MSFGHLTRASSPAMSQTATAAISGSSGGGRAQDERHQQGAVRGRRPAPALASAPGGLRGGGDERAVRRPGRRQLACAIVGRTGLAQVHPWPAKAISSPPA